MNKVVIILLIFSNVAIAKQAKRPMSIDKNYIDFQVYGTTILQGDSINQSSTSSQYKNISYTNTNVDVDFNFNKNISALTQTSIQNRENGFTRPYSMIDYVNGNNSIGALFTDTSLTVRTLALNLHNKNTSLLVGKIRPRSGVPNGLNANTINEDWYGLYGMALNGGYTNTNKIGAQFSTEITLFPHSRQFLEVALFKGDTSGLNKPAFGGLGTFGYNLPHSLNGVISQNEASNTFAPSSFSILAESTSELIENQTIAYSGYYRKQDIDMQIGSFLSPETTLAGSVKYEKVVENATLGLFGNIALVSNAFGVKDISEKYYTFSAYTNVDSFVIAFVYNLYTMGGVDSLNVNGTIKSIADAKLSQTQVSFGYKFSNQYKFDIAYRQLVDGKTQKTSQGVGIGLRYNIGTKA